MKNQLKICEIIGFFRLFRYFLLETPKKCLTHSHMCVKINKNSRGGTYENIQLPTVPH